MAVMLLAGFAGAQCVQYVKIDNMLDNNDFGDTVYFYQNDNMSTRYVMEADYTNGTIKTACGVGYDVYLPVSKQHIIRDIGNSNWLNYMLYTTNGLIILLIFVILLITILYRFGGKR